MKKTDTVIFALVMMFVFSISPTVYSQILFSDDFESGQASELWERYFSPVEPDYNLEELVEAIDMSSVPVPLATGGNYAGFLQDVDVSFTGAALSIAGESNWQNYAIEGDVYCYAVFGPNDNSAYTGLAFYCDSTIGTYIKLVADFDNTPYPRLRLYNNHLDYITFQYTFDHSFTASDIPGGIPTTDGWHHMKIEVKTINADTTAFWCYFDGEMLAGCPVYDTSDDRMSSGKAGVYCFRMDSGIPGYYDNIVVTSLVTGVEDNPVNKVNNFTLEQNYPNPFNPETKINYQLAAGSFVTLGIYDLLGREIKLLVNEEQPYGRYTVNWNGTDNFDNKVPSGIYMYTLKTGNSVFTKKMVLMK